IAGLLLGNGVPTGACDRLWHVVSCGLRGEGATAAAAAGGVRIREGEAGAHHRRHVVDRNSVQILRREGIDEYAPTILLDDEIVFGGFVLDEEAVFEPAAAARL